VAPTETFGLILAVGLAGVIALLWAWQGYERRQRGDGVSEQDARYFAGQDARRRSVLGVLALLAEGVYFGTQVEPVLQGRPNPWFLGLWLGVVALLIVLMTLALVDWVATRSYARRHRRAIVREGLQILRDGAARRAARRGEAPAGEDDDPGPTD